MTKETIKKWLEKNPPAFPANLHGESGLEFSTPGITIRDYFAAKALQGMLASHSVSEFPLPGWTPPTPLKSFQRQQVPLGALVKLNPRIVK